LWGLVDGCFGKREVVFYTFISKFGVLRYICNFNVCTISAMMINIK